ncbi:hypothetical protein GCM10022233_74790 [Streptomyces shaanxiensis]|uniref:Transposase n=1 Tax=Streptomyces shaanxiensis TaxID=653357 RepID=A0ABP7W6U0_9ACTN
MARGYPAKHAGSPSLARGASVQKGVWVAEPPQRAAQPRRNDEGEPGSRLLRSWLAIVIVRRQGLEPRTR